MNRSDIPNHDKLKDFEAKQRIIQKKIEKIFFEELVKSPKDAELVAWSLVFAPISFILNLASTAQEAGIDFSKEYPTLIKVYLNYIESLKPIEHLWGTIPVDEFVVKFQEQYSKKHITYELDKK